MDRENLFWNINSPVNRAPFQAARMPPDAPMEGKYSNLLNLRGQTLCIYVKSKVSLFVSCKHTIPAALSPTFCLIASHLSEELIPFTFQFSIFQVLLLFIENQKYVSLYTQVQPLVSIPIVDFTLNHCYNSCNTSGPMVEALHGVKVKPMPV